MGAKIGIRHLSGYTGVSRSGAESGLSRIRTKTELFEEEAT
jgi:hypothetical protein